MQQMQDQIQEVLLEMRLARQDRQNKVVSHPG